MVTTRLRKYGEKLSPQERQQLIYKVTLFQNSLLGRLADIPCALLFGGNLKMLASIYLSDKWNSHWYAQHYQALFRSIRHKRLSILEIGVGGYRDPRDGGSSLRMWRTYFPWGRVYGIDIYDKSPHDRRRIKTFQGSQTDPVFLDLVVREIGKISIIIDDGSHENEHVLFTFQHLFPHLADGGIYAIEDTQTSYWPKYGGNSKDRNDPHTSMGFFKSLVDGVNWEEFPGTYSPTYYDLNIKSIAFYHNLIVITKGSNQERRGKPQPQAVEIGEESTAK
jgi:demethylmacrocin O-methyltransferase